MAFAAVLTALGYYIILRRFCQGLLKIFLQGAATGGSFPSLPPATPAFGVLPCPCPARDGSGRSRRQGRGTALPPGAWFAPCSGAARRGQGTAPRAAFVRPAPGERTISNAEVPRPRSPLSLAGGTAHQCRVLTATPRQVSERHLNPASQETKPPAGYRDGNFSQCRAGSAPGMQGAEPLA